MAYWLLKTEPSIYSFADLEKDGMTRWDGVTNALALKHLRSMKRGDMAMIYHSGKEKAIVGIAEIASNPYRNPKETGEKIVVVDIKPKKPLERAVTLSEIKSKKEFSMFELVRIPRLSVMPVNEKMWKKLTDIANR